MATTSEEQTSSTYQSSLGQQSSSAQHLYLGQHSSPGQPPSSREPPSPTGALSPDGPMWLSQPLTPYYIYIVTHHSNASGHKRSKPREATTTCIRAYERLDPAMMYANAWWRAHLQEYYGAPLRFDPGTPALPVEYHYFLRSDERNYLAKPEPYRSQEVRVTRVWLEITGNRLMTLGERYEMGERMRQAEREDQGRWESNGAAGENGHIADEVLERYDAGDMAAEGDLGLRNGLQGIEMVHRGKPVHKAVEKLKGPRF